MNIYELMHTNIHILSWASWVNLSLVLQLRQARSGSHLHARAGGSRQTVSMGEAEACVDPAASAFWIC